VVVLPMLHRASPPRYPEMAQRLRRETDVEVVVLVDESGRVIRAELPGPPAGLGFDEAAREAALRSEFLPGSRAGVPTAMETRITVQFRLTRR
jgi:vitamin B12 transporter